MGNFCREGALLPPATPEPLYNNPGTLGFLLRPPWHPCTTTPAFGEFGVGKFWIGAGRAAI